MIVRPVKFSLGSSHWATVMQLSKKAFFLNSLQGRDERLLVCVNRESWQQNQLLCFVTAKALGTLASPAISCVSGLFFRVRPVMYL